MAAEHGLSRGGQTGCKQASVELNLHGAVHCNQPSSLCRCCAGCFSGLCQTVITIPTELLKIRLQLQTATPGMPGYVGPIRLLRQVLYREGLTGADTAATPLSWRQLQHLQLCACRN